MGLAEELQDETAEVLSRLIRFNTVNPPGNERECQEWLAGYLEDAGLTVELVGAEPERPCLVATLKGGVRKTTTVMELAFALSALGVASLSRKRRSAH